MKGDGGADGRRSHHWVPSRGREGRPDNRLHDPYSLKWETRREVGRTVARHRKPFAVSERFIQNQRHGSLGMDCVNLSRGAILQVKIVPSFSDTSV